MTKKSKYLLGLVLVLTAASCDQSSSLQLGQLPSLNNQAANNQAQIATPPSSVPPLPGNTAGVVNPPANNNSVAQTTPSPAVNPSNNSLAALGSNKYADGVLPLGDQKYFTDGPKKGYVYLCRAQTGGGGAQADGPWISSTTWNYNQKIAVAGSVSWPAAKMAMTLSGSSRVITTNDLPSGATTGTFPVAANDPAYQYDRNPNHIATQNFSFTLPAAPTQTSSPNCMGGEVGVMTNGVVLFNAFDAAGRDAAAHEVQDSCQGHPQESSIYHYHSLSSCVPNATADNVIGFAFDGFPITGPKLANGNSLTTDDLDECHGLTSSITLDGKQVTMYHYVMTEDFPYSVSCFRAKNTLTGPLGGAPGQGQQGGNNNQPSGNQPSAGQNGPPQAAIAACSGQTAGGSCSFSAPNGTVSGSCQTPPGQSSLACVPAGGPPQ